MTNGLLECWQTHIYVNDGNFAIFNVYFSILYLIHKTLEGKKICANAWCTLQDPKLSIVHIFVVKSYWTYFIKPVVLSNLLSLVYTYCAIEKYSIQLAGTLVYKICKGESYSFNFTCIEAKSIPKAPSGNFVIFLKIYHNFIKNCKHFLNWQYNSKKHILFLSFR